MQSIIYITDYFSSQQAHPSGQWSIDWNHLFRDEEIEEGSTIVELTNGLDSNVLLRLAESQVVSQRTLATLAFNSSADVRNAVADNPKTPIKTLIQLAGDQNADVRYHLAENYSLPDKILLLLCSDENPYVSCRAANTLERKYLEEIAA